MYEASTVGSRLVSRVKKAEELTSAKQLLDMDSTGGMLADYMSPGAWGSDRAGRATQMARATGQEPGMLTKYPMTTGVLSTIGGGLAGAALGGGVGAAMDDGYGQPTTGAAVGGGIIGSVGGSLLAALLRRRQMREIAQNTQSAMDAGTPLESKKPGFGWAGVLGGFLGNPHRMGQAVAHDAMTTGKVPDRSKLRHVDYAARHIVPYYNAPATLAQGVMAKNQVKQTERMKATKKDDKKPAGKDDKKPAKKDDKK